MNEILGKAKTIRELLSGTKYSIDYYQRDYKWEEKQVQELIEDLTGKFLEDHDPAHERNAVEGYGHYFLGSIIISRKDNLSFIIDGQQRLTSLTLLLIYLHNLQRDRPDAVKVDQLVFSEKYSKKSFNIDVDERIPAMEALFENEPYDATDKTESIQRIVDRYDDIKEFFPAELKEKSLPYFVDWLIENVHLVEITAYSDEDAYTIFETMNDRGLSLTPTEMLKGFILANISDSQKKTAANNLWKDRINQLTSVGKDVDADFIKSWLRSQYANSIRERKRGAKPEDFDRIGSEFHRWVRDYEDRIGLSNDASFIRFIERDFAFYSRHYLRLMEASEKLTPPLEHVFYNAQHGFTLQYPLLLAPLTTDDAPDVADKKMRLIGIFLDILLTRRIWNFRSIDYSTMQYAMFLVMRDVRHKSPPELAQILTEKLNATEETFASNDRFYLHGMNRKQIHRILARMTDYLEMQSGLQSRYAEYTGGRGINKYEVEHIWADKYERHTDEFSNEHDFAEQRNRIGDLLLLPKSFNGSYGALPYEDKLPHYLGQNVLAKSLHPTCYTNNPGFLRFVEASGLPFKAHPNFKKADLEARQSLYRALAEGVWDAQRLMVEGGAA
jgi:uncharacterized protein with ParB-like and HNH nuclease domain